MRLRKAELADAEALARVHVDSWRAAYRGLMPDALLDALDYAERSRLWREVLATREWPLFVVGDQGRIQGFCHIWPARDTDADPRTAAEITALYIDPPAWGRGYGRLLCDCAVTELARRGFSTVLLWVLENNVGARRFYEKVGFEADITSKVHQPSGLREVRYRRQLGGLPAEFS